MTMIFPSVQKIRIRIKTLLNKFQFFCNQASCSHNQVFKVKRKMFFKSYFCTWHKHVLKTNLLFLAMAKSMRKSKLIYPTPLSPGNRIKAAY